jgi:thioredoxin 2
MPVGIFARCPSCGTLNKAPLNRAGMVGKCGQCGTKVSFPHPRNPVAVTDSNFDSVVGASSEPVLLEFWSPTCGYCVKMEPAVNEIARELTGRVKVAKMDTSVNSRIPFDYGITGTPAFILLRGGKEKTRVIGAVPKEALLDKIGPYI